MACANAFHYVFNALMPVYVQRKYCIQFQKAHLFVVLFLAQSRIMLDRWLAHVTMILLISLNTFSFTYINAADSNEYSVIRHLEWMIIKANLLRETIC